jgi:hypothetical protein
MLTDQKKELLAHLIRQEFDAIRWKVQPIFIKYEGQMELVELAKEFELDGLVKEMKSDLKVK